MEIERDKLDSQSATKTLTTLEIHELLRSNSKHLPTTTRSNMGSAGHVPGDRQKMRQLETRIIELETQLRLQQHELLRSRQTENDIPYQALVREEQVATTLYDIKTSVRSLRSHLVVLKRDFASRLAVAKGALAKKFTDCKSGALSSVSVSQIRPNPVLTEKLKIQPLVSTLRDCVSDIHQKVLAGAVESIKAVSSAYSHKVLQLQAQLRSEIILRRKLHNQVIELRGSIRVFARVRPLLQEEVSRGLKSCVVDVIDESGLVLKSSTGDRRQFILDKVFGPDTANSELFFELSQLLISSLDGYNVSIMAYGATNSGKTYTMNSVNERIGLELFDAQRQRTAWRYTLSVSVCEVYLDNVVDLLNLKNMNVDIRIKSENGCLHVPGLTKTPITCPVDLERIFASAAKHRAVSSTNCNEQSSRSHLITCIHLDIVTPNGRNIESRIHLVDLAGSERMKKSGATGQTAKEAMSINKSLSALADVMHARFNKSSYIPYRNSVLTSVLNESLWGESKTLTIVQVNPTEVCRSDSSFQ